MKKLVGPLILAFSLALYLSTVSLTPFPGDSTRTIVGYLGLDHFPILAHPIYTMLARVLDLAPVATTAIRLNVLNAVLGALAAWMVFRIVIRIPHDRTFEETMSRFDGDKVRLISGFFAALFFAVSLPIWIVSTRAHTAALDLVLALASVILLLRFGETKQFGWLAGACFVWGLAMTELATCILLAPLFGLAVLYLLWRSGQLSARSVALLLGIGLGALSIHLLFAAWFHAQPVSEWREFKNYGQVLYYLLLQQYHAIVHGLPKYGWLTVMIVSFVPWVIVLFFRPPGGQGGSRGVWFGSFLLNAVLTAIAMGVLFNARLSPWSLTRNQPLLVTPYLLVAVWAGYLAGYWYVVLSGSRRRPAGGLEPLRRVFRGAYVPMLVAVIVWAAWRNLPLANGHRGAAAHQFADEVLKAMGERRWLVTNGIFDDHLRLAAREQKRDLHLINAAQSGGANAYTRYLSSLFDDTRLKSLARVAPGPLIREILVSKPEIASNLAILAAPDLWYTGGYEPVPDRVLFVGAKFGESVFDENSIARQRAFAENYGERVREESRRESLVVGWNRYILNHLGRVANNFGVYLEDQNRLDDAYASYQSARALDTNNVSALLNLHALAKRQNRPEFAVLDQEVNALAKKLQGAGRRLWALSYTYGYIRNAAHYASRGWAWAMTGKPNLAAGDMQRAMEMTGQQDSVQLVMGGMYMAQDMAEESEAAFTEVLQKDPNNRNALAGLMNLAIRRGDVDGARVYVARLEELKAPASLVKLNQAVIESLAGNPKKAKSLLNSLVQEQPSDLQAWAAVAAIALDTDDRDLLDKALAKLQAARALPPSIRMAMATIELQRKDRAAARNHLNELLRLRPGDVQALEMLLRLDVFEGQRDLAERHVEQLLTVDPRNAMANHILGTLQVYREQFALAESSFRVSLARERSAATMNDLAWVILKRGGLDEALAMVRESLALNDRSGAAWDTLGEILLRKGQLAEAEKALQQALSYNPGRAALLLNMARLYEKRGQIEEARKLADELLARPTELSREDVDDLRAMSKRMRDGA